MRGARDWLTNNPAEFVLFELGSGKPFSAREEVRILHELGYRFLGVPHVLFSMRLVPIHFGTDTSDQDIRDVLAYRDGADIAALIP